MNMVEAYSTKTWKPNADVAMAKLVNENVRVTIIFAVGSERG